MLRIKTICSTLTEYKNTAILKQNFIERGYKENILKDQIDKIDNIDRKDLLRKKEKSIKNRIPCIITCNRKLPMMRKIIKVQYVGKAEAVFNIRLNNHRKDVSNSKSIAVDLCFRKPGHSFNLHAKFTLIK